MATPLLDMLAANVEKFRSTTAKINKKYADLIPEEKTAFTALKDYWQTSTFDAAKCETLLTQMALGKKKHPADTELLEDLQEFRRLCKDYYTRDKTLFDAFKKAMAPNTGPKPEPKPDPKPDPKAEPKPEPKVEPKPEPRVNVANPLIDMLNQNVKNWKEITDRIYKKYPDLIPEEQEAMNQLDAYWSKYDFDADKCLKLLDMLALGKKKHPADYELLTDLQEFRRLCRDYYTKEKQFFVAFQKAMGGKGSKKERVIPKPEPKEEKHEQPQGKPVYGKDRIDYPNGNYYLGKYNPHAAAYEEPNGKGKLFHADGSWQEGTFKDGYLHGKGAEYDAEQERTDRGEFNMGNRTGKGVMLWADGDRYEGEWNDDGINGKGRFTTGNGSWREGIFIDGQLHGKGKQYDADNECTDSGVFTYGQLSGHVVTEWNDGQRFVAEMIDNLNGEGILYYPNGSKKKVLMVNGGFVDAKGKGGKSIRTRRPGAAGIGGWIWDHLAYVPFVFALIAFVGQWIHRGLLDALFVGLISGVVATIMFFLITYIQMFLEAIYNFFVQLPRWLNITLLVLAVAGVSYWIFGNTLRGWLDSNGKSGGTTAPANLIGAWNGVLNNNHVQLKFIHTQEGKVSAEIYFPNGNVEKLEGTVDGNNIYLKDQTPNGHYDGEYSGTIDGAIFNGKYKNPKSGAELDFKFERE
ncbi:MAG: hypothetical protein LBL97_03600 [Prevotellaceae bacterium]|jgi:hypothetical protein|nr:hypothetical protein [Prevotellaceae bacterium]